MTTVRAHDIRVPMRDGVQLAADLFTLDDDVPRPAVVFRGPYSRAVARMQYDPIGLAQDGWAVVVQDVRGRFDSGGHFDPFQQEGEDGADTISWAAGQPWCDGSVATAGSSYLGLTQWLAALENPQGLRAMAPMVIGGDVRETWMYEGGAFQLGFALPWALNMRATAPGADDATKQRAADLQRDVDATLRIPLGAHPLRELFPAFDRWMDRDDEDHWSPLDVRERSSQIEVPAFHVAGWYDIFCEGTLANYLALREGAGTEAARRGQRLLVGPWVHGGVFARGTAEFDFGPEASGTVHRDEDQVMAWLEQAVAGEQVEGGPTVFVMGAGKWMDLESWPPPATPTRLYLSSQRGANSLRGDGTLTVERPERPGTDRFRYDPHDAVPTRGGRTLGPYLPQPGPVDQRPVEEREDVLVYTSDVLMQDVTVVGSVSARVGFASEGRSADVTVKLVDVWPDGRALNVVDSVRRLDRVEPGVPVDVEVDVGSTAMCFAAGHRIRVEVSSSNFPRLDRNPSTGVPPAQATSLEPAWQTVYVGGDHASYIELPVTENP